MTMDKSFDAADAEARIAAEWERRNAFAAGANARRSETFTVMIPPPNVTGSLHMGHALNNTLQDILVRWHRMRGFDTLWQPGQDHAGIATQMVVERRMAERGEPGRREIGRDAFTAKIWDWKRESGDTIINQLKRLGASADWSRNAFTMSGAPGAPAGEEGNFHDAVIRVFVDLYNKGIIYRGKRLVNWDPHFETAISDLEVENREVPGHMWHFKHPLAGGETYEYVERDEDGTRDPARDARLHQHRHDPPRDHAGRWRGRGASGRRPLCPHRRQAGRDPRRPQGTPPPDPDHHRRIPRPRFRVRRGQDHRRA